MSMKLARALLSRVLDIADASFDAFGSLWRVAARGAFQVDAKSYRGGRFSALGAGDVLVQDVALNAADVGEARKAIELDAERLLPLSPDQVTFAVVGPIESEDRPRARPERTFLLGVVRMDALARSREQLPLTRRGAVEAFLFSPPVHPGSAFVFVDEIGRKRRRLRRASLALALAALAITSSDLARAGSAALERRVAAAEAERVSIERRIRVAERRTRDAESTQQTLARVSAPTIAQVRDRLVAIASRQPPEAEVRSLSLEGRTLSLSGATYAPEATELALRRAFEGEEIGFTTAEGDLPRTYDARLSLPREAGQ
jgi:hypothetical protein